MLIALRAFPRILAEHWPALAAWYMAGGVVRLGVMYAAAPLSRDQPAIALLLLPLAVLARLVSYVAMFLTVRDALPGFRALAGLRPTRMTPGERVREFLDRLFPAVVPFFLVYGLVGGVQDDLSTYAHIAYRYSFGSANGYGTEVGSGPIVIAIIVIAFTARQLLSRFGERLPAWRVVLEIYFEATWTYVAVTGLANVLGGAISWVRDREVVALLTDTREALVELWHGFAVALDGLGGLIPIVAQLVLNPLAWIFVGVLIYGQALPALRRERVVPQRTEIRTRARLATLPPRLRRILRNLASPWEETIKPAIVGARMIRRAGIAPLAVALLALAALYALQQWSTRGIVLAVGPHDVGFWQDAVEVIGILVAAVFEPIRIALIASIVDGMLRAGRPRPSRLRAAQPASRLS